MKPLNLLTPVIALVAIVFILVFALKCEEKRSDDYELTAARADVERLEGELQAQIAQKDTVIATVRKKRIVDSLKFASRVASLNASATHWRQKASQIRPTVIELSDSIPVLKQYFAANDSIIEKQDSTIQVQAGHIIAQDALYKIEIGAMGDKYLKQVQVSDAWREHAVSLESKLRKSERKRFSIGPYVGYGVGPNGGQGNIGVSLQYSLFKF